MVRSPPDPAVASKRILLIEDEADLAEIVRDYLLQEDMTFDLLSNGSQAVETILSSGCDLAILDLMLPGKDGLTICREVRQTSDVPIITVTAKVEEVDRLVGLELGADDYVCKPFSPREPVARVKAILRRADRHYGAISAEPARLVVDPERWVAALDGVKIEPSANEFFQGPDGPNDEWTVEALSSDAFLGEDCNNAHIQPSGDYHYHGSPTGLVDELTSGAAPSSMVLIGWAADGFPIYYTCGPANPDDLSSELVELKPT